MIVREASDDDIAFVIRNMREINAREVFAVRFSDSVDALIAQIVAWRAHAIKTMVYCADAGEPVTLIAGYLVAPGVAAMLMVSTDRWNEIAGEAYIELKHRALPLIGVQLRRVEASILAANGSREWLKRMGFVEEGIARARGKHGEDFVTMAWLNPAFVPRPETVAAAPVDCTVDAVAPALRSAHHV